MLFPAMGFAQIEVKPLLSTPYIEVTGEGEMEIIPDEIYLQFTLKERYDGKDKINIEDLEKKLKQKLRSSGIDLEKLSIADADADFVTIKRKKKDVLASKDYVLKVSSTSELAKVWEVLDDVDVANAFIKQVDHSKMDEYEKEVKIKAVKNAKEKAAYLLNAVGQQVGKALFIQERENYNPVYMPRTKQNFAMLVEADGVEAAQEPELSFQKIKLNYKVFARFAIE